MPHYGDGRATAESIREVTRNSLEKADELGCESIVIRIRGTGAAGFGSETGHNSSARRYASMTLVASGMLA